MQGSPRYRSCPAWREGPASESPACQEGRGDPAGRHSGHGRPLCATGLGAFAVAHLLYIWTLGFTPLRLRLLLPIALFSVPYAILLLRSLPADMVLPVVVYALVLACTLWRGLARGGAAGWGTLLFTVSDSVLAWSTFVGPLPHSRLVIMTTYYAAQLLLALSGVRGARPKAS